MAKVREVLSLLRSKNRCLERYLEITTEFWVSCKHGDLHGLDVFESERESALRAIGLFDRKIEQVAPQITPSERTPEIVEELRALLLEREQFVHRIVDADLLIIGKIEAAKSEILREAAAVRKSRESVAKFKSQWIADSGEELDQKL